MSTLPRLLENRTTAVKQWLHLKALKVPSLRFSERRLLLQVVDLLVINLVVYVLITRYTQQLDPTLADVWDRLYWFVVLSCLWLGIGSILGIYDLAVTASSIRSMWLVGGTAMLTAGLYLLIPFLAPGLPERRLYLFFFPLWITAASVLWRLIYTTILAQPVFHRNALVIGAGSAGRMLTRAISRYSDERSNLYEGAGYHILGFIDDRVDLQGKQVEGINVIGSATDLTTLVKQLNPDELIVAIQSQMIQNALFQAILDCREMGVPVTTVTSLYERITGRVPVTYAGRELQIVLPVSPPAGIRLYMAGRRLFDILIAILGCFVVLLVSPLIWLLNRLTAPGDLFYRQERVGEAGKLFQIVKFRSMMMDAEQGTGAVWATNGDPRVTPVGRILRRMRIDEFPQFWNVLKGDMSVIGPRPERPYFVNQLSTELPFYRVRHAVKPGITGWAQVKYRYGASAEDSLVKLEYDLYYIKHQSPYVDLQILLKTIQVVLGFKGR